MLVATHPRQFGRQARVVVPEHFEAVFARKPRARIMVYRDWLVGLSATAADNTTHKDPDIMATQAPFPVNPDLTAVALSCVQPRSRKGTALVKSLRRRLPRHIALIVGGAGAPSADGQRGIEIMSDLASLDRWLRTRPAA